MVWATGLRRWPSAPLDRHCGDGAPVRRRHQPDPDAGLGVGALEIMDQLGQILDRIDVVVRRRRDQADAGGRMADFGDHGVDLVAGQLAAFAGLGTLGHLDLHDLGGTQVGRGHAEAAGGHLLDR